MAEILEIDGVSLRGHGFGAATRSGRYSLPSRRGENLVLPGASGSMFAANKPFEEGVGALSLWAVGLDTDDDGNVIRPESFNEYRRTFENNVQKLMRFFTRSHRLSTIRAEQADGTIRRAKVEWREWSEPEVQAGGTRAEWAIAYTIPGVWWEDEAVTIQKTTASNVLPKTLSLTSFSGMTGVLEDAVLAVEGPIVNPRIADSETGAWVQYTGELTGSQSWTIDVGAFTSNVGSTSVMADTTHAGGYKLLTIPNCFGFSDTPQLVLSGTGAGVTTRLTVTGRRKWVHG